MDDKELVGSDIIAGAIKVDMSRQSSGFDTFNGHKTLQNQHVRYEHVARKKLEDGTRVEVEINPYTYINPYAYKLVISLHDKPLFWEQLQDLDPDVRVTKGVYMIKYLPRTDRKRKKGRPFLIGQDLIRWSIAVSGPKHWNKLCDEIPELDWIRRNTNFTDEYFNIAAQNPNMSFWFGVDWVRYGEKISSQLEPGTVDGNGRPISKYNFLSYKCSVEDYENKYKDKSAYIRCLNDILAEVNAAERLDEVQDEMLHFAGEGYDRSRKCPRDPETGRFINKKKE